VEADVSPFVAISFLWMVQGQDSQNTDESILVLHVPQGQPARENAVSRSKRPRLQKALVGFGGGKSGACV
jgi:hypothetical protein